MRILQLIQKKQLRGAEVFACQLSQHLVDQGHDVLVVALLDGDASLPFRGDMEVLHVNLGKKLWDKKGWQALATTIKQFNPDIVQANAGDTLKYAVLSKMICRWKAPIVFRNASMVSSYIRSSFIRTLNRFFVSRVAFVISVSTASALDLEQTLSVAKQKIEVIPVGLEALHVGKPVKQEGSLNLVHVGGFTFEKNHRGLIRILKLIRSRKPALRVWLIGDGPLRKDIEQYAVEQGVHDAIQFLGFRRDAMDYIAKADVALLPSIIEGLPGVVLEAFYAETPVVVYDVGGVRDVVKHEVTGMLIPRDDEEAFADAVVTTLDHPDKTAVRVANARELVKNSFMNREIAIRFAKRYQQLMQSAVS